MGGEDMRAIIALRQLDFTLSLAEGKIHYRFTGDVRPEEAVVRPLLTELKARRREAIEYLQKETAALFLKSFKKALAEPNCRYQPGTLDFIESHYPDLSQQIERAEEELDSLWREGDPGLFGEALRRWQELHEQAIQAYARPEFSGLVTLLHSGKARHLSPLRLSPAETVTDAETFLRSYLRDLAHPKLGDLAYRQLLAFLKALKKEETDA
jgi:hypothetical protein